MFLRQKIVQDLSVCLCGCMLVWMHTLPGSHIQSYFCSVCGIGRPCLHHFPYSSASPLACGVVDLVALATADGDGVEGLEGAQTHSGDGHEAGGEHDEDGLGVVEGHRQVMAHRDHQRISAAAEAPLTCGENIKYQQIREDKNSSRQQMCLGRPMTLRFLEVSFPECLSK